MDPAYLCCGNTHYEPGNKPIPSLPSRKDLYRHTVGRITSLFQGIISPLAGILLFIKGVLRFGLSLVTFNQLRHRCYAISLHMASRDLMSALYMFARFGINLKNLIIAPSEGDETLCKTFFVAARNIFWARYTSSKKSPLEDEEMFEGRMKHERQLLGKGFLLHSKQSFFSGFSPKSNRKDCTESPTLDEEETSNSSCTTANSKSKPQASNEEKNIYLLQLSGLKADAQILIQDCKSLEEDSFVNKAIKELELNKERLSKELNEKELELAELDENILRTLKPSLSSELSSKKIRLKQEIEEIKLKIIPLEQEQKRIRLHLADIVHSLPDKKTELENKRKELIPQRTKFGVTDSDADKYDNPVREAIKYVKELIPIFKLYSRWSKTLEMVVK